MALDFNPLEFFKEEIKQNNAQIRIGAVEKLNLIASAMGPQKTVSDLIPFLDSAINEMPYSNDEEFLYSVAKQLAVLSDYINGQDEILIKSLEHLASQEETVIREQAIKSLCTLVEKQPSLVQQCLLPSLHRLATEQSFFTARVSACALFQTAYKFTEDEGEKDKLRKAYVNMCADDTPMVRRAAAHKMKDLVEVVEKADFLHDMISVFKLLSQDDTQDTIRVAVVNATLVVAKMFNAEENLLHTVSVINDATEDRSWRVRLTVAKSFPKLCENFGAEIVASHLIPCIITLMKDHEQEVRKEAVKAIEALIEICLTSPDLMSTDMLKESILPQFTNHTVTDASQAVRAALSQVLGPVAKFVGRDVTQRVLLPIISDLMKDEFHEVRLNIVYHAGLIFQVLSVDGLPSSVLTSLLQTIQSLIMDNHWRIRQSVIMQVPTLAKLFGVEMFESKLESLILSSLNDSVHSVRIQAIANLKEIAATFGPTWTVDHLMPKITDMHAQSAGYANRVTTLEVLPNVSLVMNPAQVGSLVVPMLLKATKDGVPNVRFCACRKIQWVMENHKLPQQVINSIKAVLVELENDSDMDVQYYARQALKKLPGA